MNHPHEQQAAAMARAGELTDGEQLRECVNSGQVSAAQVVAHAEASELSMSMFASRKDFDEAVDERKCLEQLKDVTAEQRSKFEAWSTSTEPFADVREMLTHRRPDGQYSMLTMRAGFAAWIGGALTERDTNTTALAAERAEVARLREALEVMLKQFTKTPSSLRDSEARIMAHKALTAPGEKHE